MDVSELRSHFPQLGETVYGKQLVYLDNAATSLRPDSVISKWTELSSRYNSNLHRAVHHTAAVATEEYETARDAVKDFVGAEFREEIIFTSGATASLNLLAFSIGESFISEGDEIIVTRGEHHSDIVPWQMMASRKGAVIKVLDVDEDGCLRINELESLITDRTKLCCVAHISNVLGLVNPVKDIASICHSRGCIVSIDGAQGIVHQNVNVRELDCDFYSFSGHKMYAAPGTGVVYGKKSLLEKMVPYMGGGEMIATVTFEGTTYAQLPNKFEAGTQNMAGTPTFKPAIELMESLRSEYFAGKEREITGYLLDALGKIEGLRIYGVPRGTFTKIPLFSFSVQGVHHEDLALILDKMGIAVRSGQMCAEPLMDRFGVTGMLRASFAPYNTLEEAEYFVKCLQRAINMLK